MFMNLLHIFGMGILYVDQSRISYKYNRTWLEHKSASIGCWTMGAVGAPALFYGGSAPILNSMA